MEKREQLISQITALEYRMMDQVQSIDGRASCQDDEPFFRAMRSCQFASWDEASMESYLDDLIEAEKNGRNLVSEKYAYMMERTDPENYEKIKHFLPDVSEEKMESIEKICMIHGNWQRGLAESYPHIVSQGRSYEDDEESLLGGTSFLTYLKGELKTYSDRTILLYKDLVMKNWEAGVNMNLENMKKTVMMYGYQSIEEAEKKNKNMKTLT